MDIRKVKKLIELLPAAAPMNQAVPLAAPPTPKLPATAAGEHKPRNDDQTITSPMVGTYYSASAPGAKPFVEIGMEIKVGQILCIIEAMKMMNQIESDKTGRITAILAKNGEPVEFGQPLFIIE
jgi:acetyl-CoA carboxylase biotin carboxyl carrier protein